MNKIKEMIQLSIESKSPYWVRIHWISKYPFEQNFRTLKLNCTNISELKQTLKNEGYKNGKNWLTFLDSYASQPFFLEKKEEKKLFD